MTSAFVSWTSRQSAELVFDEILNGSFDIPGITKHLNTGGRELFLGSHSHAARDHMRHAVFHHFIYGLTAAPSVYCCVLGYYGFFDLVPI